MTGTRGPVLDVAFVTAALGPRLRHPAAPAFTHNPAHNLPARTRFDRAVVDSREVRPGDLFVALPGDRVDGHDYAAAAVAAGAAGVLATREAAIEGVPLFVVDDSLAALQDLSAAWRAALPLDVVGVTGSVGKTTTKAIVAAVLGAKYRVQANPLNYNNEISVPLCLLELKPETQRAVIEMGMYTTGEIALLCQWAQPRAGIVLNVGPTHLERAGSIEAIAEAKSELVQALPADGVAILNVDDPMVRGMVGLARSRVMWFGTDDPAEVRATDVVSHGAEGFEFTLHHQGDTRRLRVRLPGRHLVSNVLAGAAAGLADGLSLRQVGDAIEALAVPTRMRVITRPDGTRIIDDTYNAQPSSMLAALDLVDEMPGRHIALLGDMRELGVASGYEHQRVGERAGEVLDALVTLGDEARTLGEAALAAGGGEIHHATSREEAAALLWTLVRPGDVVLVKGSHALGLEAVVAELERSRGPEEPER
ncbi:MAG: UDP-N-acetylmuramoyl-tripeptide--D-alanyl-D-alanine ligase [Dehalococcoidia bacterium]|nr:UDP-N-acetylmuramoyl-tripeptide--D-alanyl-D-alanine ligase [Dehalococcoidia bacterium]